MADFRSAALDYVRFVLSSMGETPTTLARMAGLSSTTLTRPLNDKMHKYSISMSTLEKICHATGYEFAPFLSEDMDSVSRTLDTYVRTSDYMLVDGVSDLSSNDGHNGTPVIGTAQVGLWMEERFIQPPGYFLAVRHPSSELQKHCALINLNGNNIDKVAQPGELLFCHMEGRGGGPFLSGDLVVIERTDLKRRIFEVSAKVVRAAPGKPIEFVDASNDPKFSASLSLGRSTDEEVRVAARVLFVMRFPADPNEPQKPRATTSA